MDARTCGLRACLALLDCQDIVDALDITTQQLKLKAARDERRHRSEKPNRYRVQRQHCAETDTAIQQTTIAHDAWRTSGAPALRA